MTSKLVVNEIAADTGISTITVGDNMSGVTFKTGTSNLHNVGIEIAGINVLGADTPIGAGATIYNSGDVIVGGAVTATSFSGSGASLTGLTATSVTVTDESSDTLTFPLFVTASVSGGLVQTANLAPQAGSNFYFNSSSGALTATSFVGSGANLTGIALTSLNVNGNTNNNLITATGNQYTVQGESTLTYDGTILEISNATPKLKLTDSDATGTPEAMVDGSGGDLILHVDKDNEKGSSLFAVKIDGSERIRIDSSGRVLIGGGSSPTQVGDGNLIVYSSDRKHPSIKLAGLSNNQANGYTMLGDNYQADESQVNLGVSYSSSSLVLSRCVKVSDAADNTYLSSQDSYNARPTALVLDNDGALRFHTTEYNTTVATDSAVSLTEVFKIDKVGNIYQRITGRYMWFGASNQLQIGVNGSDGYINSASGDLQIRDSGNPITVVRSDGFQMYQDIYFATAGKGICLGTTSNTDSNTLDDYEEGSWVPEVRIETRAASDSPIDAVDGCYTKVGQLVTCHGKFTLNGTPSERSTNRAIEIRGFPFDHNHDWDKISGDVRVTGHDLGSTYGSDISFVLRMLGGLQYCRMEILEHSYNGTRNASVVMQDNMMVQFSFTYVTV